MRRSLKLREISSVVIYLNLFGEYGESLIRALLGHPHLTSIHLDRDKFGGRGMIALANLLSNPLCSLSL